MTFQITIDSNRAASYLKVYGELLTTLAADRGKRARLAGHYSSAEKALKYLLSGGGYRIVAPGCYEFQSQSGDPDGPWRADGDGCDCKGAFRGYCWHGYAVQITQPWDDEIARAVEREARRQRVRGPMVVDGMYSEGQHLVDDPGGAVYRSVTRRVPETVAIAPNRGEVTREMAMAEGDDLFNR